MKTGTKEEREVREGKGRGEEEGEGWRYAGRQADWQEPRQIGRRLYESAFTGRRRVEGERQGKGRKGNERAKG